MSNNNRTHQAGLGCLILLLGLAWLVTLVGQLIGLAWYWPWLFLVGLIVATATAGRNQRKEREARAEENKPRFSNFDDYKMPHLTTVPGQYTRRPCDKPEWISIPLYRDYQIHCSTLEVRNKFTGDIIQPGYDPEGKSKETFIELMNGDNQPRYVEHSWIVQAALGKGHS